MRIPPRPVRRALAPLLVAVELALLVAFAVGIVVGALAALVSPPRRLLRVSSLAAGYLCVQLAIWPLTLWLWVVRSVRRDEDRWLAANRLLLSRALDVVLAMARRCVGFRVELVGPPGPIEDAGPVVVLARHGGPGDSFALVQLLLARDRRVHIVLKDVLELDPGLDILLNRLGSCYLPSAAGAGEDLPARLAALARGLEGRDTLLVFPEGGNWTPRRRTRAIRRLRADHHDEAARAATLMANVLPPRPAGVMAVLEARPDLPVALKAHAGLDRLTTLRAAWAALPLSTPMVVRAWSTAPVPPDAQERLAWLTTEWATVDEWVDAWHTANPGAPGPMTDSPA